MLKDQGRYMCGRLGWELREATEEVTSDGYLKAVKGEGRPGL